jgi:hypothetical protein
MLRHGKVTPSKTGSDLTRHGGLPRIISSNHSEFETENISLVRRY